MAGLYCQVIDMKEGGPLRNIGLDMSIILKLIWNRV